MLTLVHGLLTFTTSSLCSLLLHILTKLLHNYPSLSLCSFPEHIPWFQTPMSCLCSIYLQNPFLTALRLCHLPRHTSYTLSSLRESFKIQHINSLMLS